MRGTNSASCSAFLGATGGNDGTLDVSTNELPWVSGEEFIIGICVAFLSCSPPILDAL
jgi:hypothetical protein